MYYTYMLRCVDGSIYTGITTEPARRLREHIQAGKRAAGYTRSHKAEGFIAIWQSEERSMASRLEALIKSLPKNKRRSLPKAVISACLMTGLMSADIPISFQEKNNTNSILYD